MNRVRIVGGLTAALLLATGCQLRAQDRPVPAPEVTEQVRSAPTAAPPRTQQVTVFLVRQQRLVAVTRSVEPGPDRLTSALRALVRDVDPTERGNNLVNAVPSDTPAPAWQAGPGGLTIELPGSFDGLDTSGQVLAVAQVVFTVTENSDADRLSFLRAGAAVDVPDATGRLLSRPVARSDYGRLTE